MLYTVKTKPKGKNIAVLSTFCALHGKTIDDGKQKPQIIKLYYFTKGGTYIIDQLTDYYTTRAKSCRGVTVALFYILET